MNKLSNRQKIKYRIRKTVKGTAERPRMTVFRSNKHIIVQLIDDMAGNTLLSVSSASKELEATKGTKTEIAAVVGKTLASKAVEKGITSATFDRNGYLYHGRVKQVAEAARENGLKI